METKRVAVWSGGGAKGLIQVACAAGLQAKRGIDFNKDFFDLYVGESVGAINCAVLASGVFTPVEFLRRYSSFLQYVFKSKFWPLVPKYDRGNVFRKFAEFLPLDTKFKSLHIPTAIGSVDDCSDQNIFFKSWDDKNGEELLITILARSFAAPFYFGQINDPINKCVWYDGGCGTSNIPIDHAINFAINNKWLNNYKLEFWIFGTGYSDESTPYGIASSNNFIEQIFSFLSPDDGGMARAQSRIDQINRVETFAKHCDNVGVIYFDAVIPKQLDKMDNIKFLDAYFHFGDQMSEKPLLCVNC